MVCFPGQCMRYSTMNSILGMIGAAIIIIGVFLPLYHLHGEDIPLSNKEPLVGLLYTIIGSIALVVVKSRPSVAWMFGFVGLISIVFVIQTIITANGFLGTGMGCLILGSVLLIATSSHIFEEKTIQT